MHKPTICLAILAAAPLQAWAQSPPPAPAAAPPSVSGVVVTTESSGLRTSIDRRSYGVASDLQTTTGSVADALRNIPSVQVDVAGEISLRGDVNVTILVDGKPSPLLSSAERATALQQMGAGEIERIEVITNPSASMSPDGTAGVINLIRRSTFRPGYSGAVRSAVGTDQRYNHTLNLSYQDGKATVTAAAGLRQDQTKALIRDVRQRRPTEGGPASVSLLNSDQISTTRVASGRLGATYDRDDRTRVGAEIAYREVASDNGAIDHQELSDPSGAVIRVLDRINDIDALRKVAEFQGSFRKRFSGDGHELTGSIAHERNFEERDRKVTSLGRLPLQPDALEAFDFDASLLTTNVRLDYTRPLPGEATLKAGYALTAENNLYENLVRRGPTTAALSLDPALTYAFDYRQDVHAAYATYERPFSDLTVLAGLRLEQVKLDVGLRGAGAAFDNAYLKAFPSLHLSYDLTEAQRVTASFSQRLQRPRPDDLNPFRIYIDPFNLREGNPALLPQMTRAYELGYQYRKNGVVYLATLYYRTSSDGITDVVRDLGGGAFLTRRENLSDSRSGGAELVANGRFSRTLTYNVSGNLFWNEIDASTLGFPRPRSDVALSGRANLNWQVTPDDLVQLNGVVNSRRLTAQGYLTGFSTLNLGYRHKVSDSVNLLFTAQNMLQNPRQVTVFDTPLLTGRSRRTTNQRAVFLTLTWTFGSRRQTREPGFEFDGAGD